MNIFKLCVVFAAVVIFIAACGQTATTPSQPNTATNLNKTAASTPAPPDQPVDELATAKDLYMTNCMICHKDTGKGGKVTVEGKNLNPADLTSAKMKVRSDDKLSNGISEGSPDDGMPAFKAKLTDAQIKLIVKYVRSLQGS